jgi:hypothetical protein
MIRRAHGDHRSATDWSPVAKRRWGALLWFTASLLFLVGVLVVAWIVAIVPVPGMHSNGTRCGGLVAEYLTNSSVVAGTCTDGASDRALTTGIICGSMIVMALVCGAVGRWRLGRST